MNRPWLLGEWLSCMIWTEANLSYNKVGLVQCDTGSPRAHCMQEILPGDLQDSWRNRAFCFQITDLSKYHTTRDSITKKYMSITPQTKLW